jgi:uncharacterized protein YndB with AHSA1/START domain
MSKRFFFFLLFVIYSMTVLADGEWNWVSDDDGVTLYARALKGRSTSEVKGTCVVDRPIEAVASLLSDIASYPKWFFRCIQSHKIPSEDSADSHFLLYVVIDTPWPFADRDVVYRVETTIDHAAQKVVVHSTAIHAPWIAHKTNAIRITDSQLQWTLQQQSSGQTRITFINRTHAAGFWGDYISDSGTHATTLHSLKNLKSLLKRGYSHKGTSITGHGAFSRMVIPI